ncbi:LacI family DNA-binding transcriptional regulator [Paenibacillus agricola]|uniref:LacI family transcriptional regulator n=1 Tax=Paenibacillus agricola TaxID=2716264 RepID=A0ABX0J944_9BACL|nr:LacI family DNA-binding transcriptional regulator [Paenibacillus agricola]NHN32962.1 LacI family transcriptional regulator [Paenibacillus agricola]
MARKKSITLLHIAKELGLTIQTVSKALRGHPGMSEETRGLVVKTAASLGYRTKDQLRQLEQERIAPYPVFTRRFILVQSEQSLGFLRLLLRGLHERFAEFGHRIDTLLLPEPSSPAVFHRWLELHDVGFADGIFIAPRILPGFMEESLLELPLPRILLNYPPPEAKVDSVVWDVYEAMYIAVRTLIRAGHRRIMYVGDIHLQRGFILRWQAFREAMKEIGVQVTEEEHAVARRDAGEPWLDDFAVKYEQYKPTAVICGIDEEVAPVYYRLQSWTKVPEGCSLVGFLNEPIDHLPLVDRPALLIRETGYRAADRMLWRAANPQQPYEHIRLKGDFVRGKTMIKQAR